MIALEHQRLQARQRADHVRRAVPQVGQHPQPHAAIVDHVLHRFARIVRHRYRLDQQAGAFKGRVRIDDAQQGAALIEPRRAGHRAQRAMSQMHGDAVRTRQPEYAADVVAVLVRYQDRIELLGCAAGAVQPALDLAAAEAAIDHQPRGARTVAAFDQQGIALAAAAQAGEAHAAALAAAFT